MILRVGNIGGMILTVGNIGGMILTVGNIGGMILTVGNIGGMILTGENTSTGRKTLFQCLLVHHNYHMDCPGIEAGPRLLHNKDQTVGADVRIVQNMFCVHN